MKEKLGSSDGVHMLTCLRKKLRGRDLYSGNHSPRYDKYVKKGSLYGTNKSVTGLEGNMARIDASKAICGDLK